MHVQRFRPPRFPADVDHGIVYRHEQEFAGWPFLGGLWRVGSGDIVAAFTRLACAYGGEEDVHHNNLTVSQGLVSIIRSSNGGATWEPDSLQAVFDKGTTADEISSGGEPNYASEAPVDLRSPDTLILSRGIPGLFVPSSKPWICLSADGGRSWRRPTLLNAENLGSLSGHASVSVRADGVGLIGMTRVTPDGWVRRPLVYASADGGRTWNFLSFITPETDDGAAVSPREGSPRFGAHRYFYPRPLPLRDGRILCSMRCQRNPTNVLWTEIFESLDGGRTWAFLSRVNDWGAPGDIVEMADGRIVCVYGYRVAPFGVRARVSVDGGRTWESELILRDDGGSWDLGYPRVMEVSPGRIMAVYYFNRNDDPVQLNGGVRHIARTIFTPE
jgi:hypothetical protein